MTYGEGRFCAKALFIATNRAARRSSQPRRLQETGWRHIVRVRKVSSSDQLFSRPYGIIVEAVVRELIVSRALFPGEKGRL